MNAKRFIIIALLLASVLGAGCISDSDSPSTTAPAEDSFYLSIVVDGEQEYEIGLSEIKSLPFVSIDATMVKKTGEEFATHWGGTLIQGVFDHLGIEGATSLVFVALDGYEREIQYDQLQEAILAWEDEDGSEITEDAGGPVRLIAPGLPANAWIANLYEIRAESAPLDSYYLSIAVDGQKAPLSVGISEIMALGPVVLDATMTKKDGSDVTTSWTGVYMNDLLESQGIARPASASFVASDGYVVTIADSTLNNVFVAWADGEGAELTEDDGGPLRTIVPGAAAQKWMQLLTEIRIVPLPEETEFVGIVINGSETMVGMGELKMYPSEVFTVMKETKDGSEVETTWTGTLMSGVLEALGATEYAEVTFVAADGYSKTLSYEEVSGAILAWADGEGAELGDDGPLESVVPGQSASKWIKNLSSIQVTG